MRRVKLISDYTPLEEPFYLDIIKDDQGDVYITPVNKSEESSVRIAASGTRYSHKVRDLLYKLIQAIEDETSEKGKVKRIMKALEDKGYAVREVSWDVLGGWVVEYGENETILGTVTEIVLSQINELPAL